MGSLNRDTYVAQSNKVFGGRLSLTGISATESIQ